MEWPPAPQTSCPGLLGPPTGLPPPSGAYWTEEEGSTAKVLRAWIHGSRRDSMDADEGLEAELRFPEPMEAQNCTGGHGGRPMGTLMWRKVSVSKDGPGSEAYTLGRVALAV